MNKDGGAYSIVFDFPDFDGGVGRLPIGITEGSDGKLYGTTRNYFGSVWKLNKDGSGANALWDFSPTGGDVSNPSTGLIEGTNGRLYGGGYSMNKDGSDYALGANPANISFIQGSDGSLYGALPFGGALDGGTVFSVNQDGSAFVSLRDFDAGTFGSVTPPHSPVYVFEASDQKLYGICGAGGGTYEDKQGSVFCINRDGSGYTNVLVFADIDGPASSPNGRLIEGSDGRLYGTTGAAGYPGYQTIFGVNKDGSGFAI